MDKFQDFLRNYPTIYGSCYEIIANSEAAKCVSSQGSDEYKEEEIDDILYEIFKYNYNIGVYPDSMLIHSFYRDCCIRAKENMDIVINGYTAQN